MPASIMLTSILLPAAITLMACLFILSTKRWHGRHSLDYELVGAQKFHHSPVPRIGGLAITIGLFGAILFDASYDAIGDQRLDKNEVLNLLWAGMPAFIAGLIEDITKKSNISNRMAATFISPLLACWLLGALLPVFGILGVEQAMQGSAIKAIEPTTTLVAITITLVVVAGFQNSINIIDGFNGLAASTVAIMLGAIAFLAWQVGDALVVYLALLGVGVSIGFLVLNYPSGKIFLGDGGAYLLGFWLAESAVLLITRNHSVNPWQVVAICAYPIIETAFSMYRKKVIRGMSPCVPDRVHFHMLVYRRLVCQTIQKNVKLPWLRNALVAPMIAALVLFADGAALVFGASTVLAIAIIAVQVGAYLVCYQRMVHGKWSKAGHGNDSRTSHYERMGAPVTAVPSHTSQGDRMVYREAQKTQ